MPTAAERLADLERRMERVERKQTRTRNRLKDLVRTLTGLAQNGMMQGLPVLKGVMVRDEADDERYQWVTNPTPIPPIDSTT